MLVSRTYGGTCDEDEEVDEDAADGAPAGAGVSEAPFHKDIAGESRNAELSSGRGRAGSVAAPGPGLRLRTGVDVGVCAGAGAGCAAALMVQQCGGGYGCGVLAASFGMHVLGKGVETGAREEDGVVRTQEAVVAGCREVRWREEGMPAGQEVGGAGLYGVRHRRGVSYSLAAVAWGLVCAQGSSAQGVVCH